VKKKLVTALVAMSATAGALAPATAMAAAPEATAAPAARVATAEVQPRAAAAACNRKCAARAVSLERVYGPLYGRYKAIYPHPQLNWNNDGCSFPSWMYDIRGLGKIVKAYGGKFQKSCDRHDFGYRNHGRSGLSRHTIDVRFRDNMYHQCNVQHTDGLPPWIACRAAAKVMFEVVDTFGHRFW
jgi:hypothetical protein